MGYFQYPNIPIHTIIWCTGTYRGKPWYDLVMVRASNAIVPSRVVGIIELEGVKKFLIHTSIHMSDGIDGPSKLLETFFVHFVLRDLNHIDAYDVIL